MYYHSTFHKFNKNVFYFSIKKIIHHNSLKYKNISSIFNKTFFKNTTNKKLFLYISGLYLTTFLEPHNFYNITKNVIKFNKDHKSNQKFEK